MRPDGRNSNAIRSVKIHYDTFGYADTSVLLEIGQTKVLASVTLQHGVPVFLKGQRTGWLSAEYAMLPSATHQRSNRESSQVKQNSRSIEISRLIGRCLRPTIDLSKLGERTIIIDCDVLQADGGTRVASITAASIALERAAFLWKEQGIVSADFFKTKIAAISVGIVNKNPIVDLSYVEDSNADADFNFVMTQEYELIEVQGTAEKTSVSWNTFEVLKNLAIDGIKNLFVACNKSSQSDISINNHQNNLRKQEPINSMNHRNSNTHTKPGLFSLGNRLSKES